MNLKQLALLGVVSVFLIALASHGFKFQVFNPNCKIIQPTWAYFECEKSPNVVDKQFHFTSSGDFGHVTYYRIKCSTDDVVENGLSDRVSTFSGLPASCKVIFLQTNGLQSLKICRGSSCQSIKMPEDKTIYLAYGEDLEVGVIKPLFGDNVIQGSEYYYQKRLYRKTWTGRKDFLGVGCTIKTLTSDWKKLPAGSELSLRVGQTVNYIDTFIEVPVVGNYYNYNGKTVVAQPSGNGYDLYEINPYGTATPTSSGKYETKSGECYYVLGDFVAHVECLPGQTFQGSECGSDFKWHKLDKGQCIRGGIASDAYCPGGGLYLDPTQHTLTKYSCNVETGNCDVVWSKHVECYPGKLPCPAGQYCDLETYTCKQAGQQLLPCPYDWCPAGSGYQEKHCPPGLQACPDFTCKKDCSNTKPVIPKEEVPTNEKKFDWWNLLWSSLAGAFAFLKLGEKSLKRKDWVGIAMAGIVAIAVFIVVGWILKHLMQIAVGGLLGIAFGGIILYFFGPAILFVVIMFMEIVRTIKG